MVELDCITVYDRIVSFGTAVGREILMFTRGTLRISRLGAPLLTAATHTLP